MHNGLLKMGTAKMAGSVGNVVNIADLLKRHTAETVRFLLLSTHYRSPIEYSEERLAEIAKSLEAFHRFFERYERLRGESFYSLPEQMSERWPTEKDIAVAWAYPELTKKMPELWRRFHEYMEDDFNTGGAVGVLYELLGLLNKFADESGIEVPSERSMENVIAFGRGTAVLRQLSSLLGLFWQPPAKQSLGGGDVLVSGLMQLLLDLRNNLRATAKEAAKDNPLKKALFDQTDLIRKRLAELGVTLEDRPGGTTWRVG
jgi:cysteinyl-tRNA synthetase